MKKRHLPKVNGNPADGQKSELAVGIKEEAKSLNYFLDSLTLQINAVKTEMIYSGKTITTEKIMNEVLGRTAPKIKVMEEFQKHNDEMQALLGKGYARTLYRFTITKNHLTAFIKFKFKKDDVEFTDLNLEFVKEFEFYLRTVRDCSNNTTLKYIANFKKIVIRAIDNEIINKDPFKNFKGRKTKLVKKPITAQEWYVAIKILSNNVVADGFSILAVLIIPKPSLVNRIIFWFISNL